jgi:hypothetical protein
MLFGTRECVLGEEPPRRLGFAAGMGVDYINQQDLVEMINGSYTLGKRVDQFVAGAEFFGSGRYRVGHDWALKLAYAYIINSYTTDAPYGPGEFTVTVHAPSVIVQYLLFSEEYYDIRAGLGAGYRFGSVEISYGTIQDRYSASGPGIVVDLEGNTALGDDVYVYLGGVVRWDMMDDLRSANGTSPGVNASGHAATLGQFAVGLRIGLSWFL